MRRAFLVLLTLGTLGCKAHQTFDEHYAQTENDIRQRAAKLGAQANGNGADERAAANTQQGPAK